jgi:hypothetical protein
MNTAIHVFLTAATAVLQIRSSACWHSRTERRMNRKNSVWHQNAVNDALGRRLITSRSISDSNPNNTKIHTGVSSSRAVEGVGLKLLDCWDRELETHWGHGCSSLVFVVWETSPIRRHKSEFGWSATEKWIAPIIQKRTFSCLLIPVAAWSKAWVCGRSLVAIVDSNPAGGIDVCLVWMLCVVT